MSSARKALPSSGNSNLCEVCGIKAKYVDGWGVTHSYCGRTCAARSSTADVTKKSPPCKIRGCNNAEDPNLRGFCSDDHAKCVISSSRCTLVGYSPCVTAWE
ncbi:hypothetical protein SCLCIDRAFT_914121 [Scleroderma citrinum Foug A]|uniref:Uncharacterized protein n=1 Tax=Scleroderma citrinum Foug A TaxID=1036808 RepID=A0A0C2ZI18_9AGAM|nr:hypothetical protein SCLCIDRAFT_914121 [Scleroderma citrinum Foug A]